MRASFTRCEPGVYVQFPPTTWARVWMSDSHFCCNSGKSSTVPELFPKKYVPLMLFRSLRVTSTFPTTLSTCTLLLNPLVIPIPCVLFMGNPEPSHAPELLQPAIFKLAALTPKPLVLAANCKSAMASGMLSAQSPANPNAQLPFAAMCCIEGLVTPPNELPTL